MIGVIIWTGGEYSTRVSAHLRGIDGNDKSATIENIVDHVLLRCYSLVGSYGDSVVVLRCIALVDRDIVGVGAASRYTTSPGNGIEGSQIVAA